MSDHDDESADQTEEIFQELLEAERLQEITQTTTMQGQIVALVLILKDVGLLTKSMIDDWETKSEEVAELLLRMAKANEVRTSHDNDDPVGQLEMMLDGMNATIDFTRLMGNTDETLAPLIQQRNKLADALAECSGNGT